jgi:streptomycin 3"-adenylyltransferase
MNLPKSLACSDETRRRLTRYVGGIANVLGDNLFGIYLYGSLARGCYHPATSDVDIVVITRAANSDCCNSAILGVYRQAGGAIDAVFLTEDQMSADEFPARVGFLVKAILDHSIIARIGSLVKSISGYSIIRPTDGVRRDFLLQRQDVFEAGVALFGPPPQAAVRPVPWALLAESLDFLLPNIVPHFKNPVLMLCRIAYAHEHRMLCSKSEAGIWAAKAFGDTWEAMIEEALREYASGVSQTGISTVALAAFEEYCTDYIRKRR